MTPESRREDIARYVIQQGEARIDDLVQRFGVSRMTIHRHIEHLAQRGVLRKLHGAVSALPSAVYESLFSYRQTVAPAQKAALARAALQFVQPGQVVMLDDSSTAMAMALLLAEKLPLTVITNSLGANLALAGVEGVDLIHPGGQFHATYNAFIGHVCETALPRLRAHVLILSASAVQGTTAFIQDPQLVRIKQAMMAAASARVLLLDSGKFGRTALHVLDDLTAFDAVLVDDGLPQADIETLTAAGVRLHVIETEAL